MFDKENNTHTHTQNARWKGKSCQDPLTSFLQNDSFNIIKDLNIVSKWRKCVHQRLARKIEIISPFKRLHRLLCAISHQTWAVREEFDKFIQQPVYTAEAEANAEPRFLHKRVLLFISKIWPPDSQCRAASHPHEHLPPWQTPTSTLTCTCRKKNTLLRKNHILSRCIYRLHNAKWDHTFPKIITWMGRARYTFSCKLLKCLHDCACWFFRGWAER